jgi:hypothetical protein
MAGERAHRHTAVVATLRALVSPDVELSSGLPDDPQHFCILVQALVGPRDQVGEESFSFSVCTPKWLQSYVSKNRFLFGSHYLIVDCYDYSLISGAISDLCQRTSGSSWNEVAEKLSRYGAWEFEDYTE